MSAPALPVVPAPLSLVVQWKPYPAYKESGVEWLGEVPEHWVVKRLRFAAQTSPSKSEVSNLSPDTQVSFLPMEQIGEDGQLSLQEVRVLEEVQQGGYTYFRDGDVVVAKITPCFENGKGALCAGLLNGVGFGTTELHVIRVHKDIDSKFVFYITKSRSFRILGAAMMRGSAGQQRVPDDFVKDFPIALPSLVEQHAIATFLDCETTMVDTLIAKKERQIKLLQEKRAAIISHTVTKGLDASVPLKDSGMGWLGEIPAHWEVRRLKFAAQLESGHTPSRTVPEYWENTTIPYHSKNSGAGILSPLSRRAVE